MNLLEALQIIKRSRNEPGKPFRLTLLCGFTPLHLETFLVAHVASQAPLTAVTVSHGIYGDLAGNLERCKPSEMDAAAVVVEWADLDARLGARSAGGWDPSRLSDILQCVRMQLQRIGNALHSLAPQPVVVSLPTLPLPPVSYARPAQLSAFEAELRSEMAVFAASLAAHPHLRVLSAQEIDKRSPLHLRLNLKSELDAGFPYSLDHADEMARLLAGFLRPPDRKKGLITDLDDTLWRGILGEIGAAQVNWSLEGHAQIHGLYQQLLASLAASGTLVGVASKNDPALVEEALARRDILLPAERVFPIEAHWGPKSESVARILKAWNIGPDAVLFVDDSPMELAEVQAAFPALECLLFPKDDPEALWNFLYLLRDRFGAAQLQVEDSLRSDNLRSRAKFQAEIQSDSAGIDTFLQHAEAEITFTYSKKADPRAFELLNKTNQFNLNGERVSESEWNSLLASENRFVLKAAYKDRFGSLGTIAVLAGTRSGDSVMIDHWVMSCRAFSRRIEHRCLAWVFDHFEVGEVAVRFVSTPRNGPLQEFLATFLGIPPWQSLRIPRALFQEKCPALYHSLLEIA
jgi:FkbH-like protein